MKAISMRRAWVMPKITLSRVTGVIVTNRIPLGIVGAVATMAGAMAEADTLMFAGAIIAMMAVRPEREKGGER